MINNAKGQQREILKLGLQSTEAYFPCIAYVLFVLKRSEIHAANIEASKFFVCFCR